MLLVRNTISLDVWIIYFLDYKLCVWIHLDYELYVSSYFNCWMICWLKMDDLLGIWIYTMKYNILYRLWSINEAKFGYHPCRKMFHDVKNPRSFYDVGKILPNQLYFMTFVKCHKRYFFHDVNKTSLNQLYFTMFVTRHKRYFFHDVNKMSLNQPTFYDIWKISWKLFVSRRW